MCSEYTIDNIKLYDAFLIYGGRNHHGQGKQLAIVNKITKHGNIYCEKFSIRKKHCIGLKCKLDADNIISKLEGKDFEPYLDQRDFMESLFGTGHYSVHRNKICRKIVLKPSHPLAHFFNGGERYVKS